MGLCEERESISPAGCWGTGDGEVSHAHWQLGFRAAEVGAWLPAACPRPSGAQGVQQVPATLLLLHPLPTWGHSRLTQDLSHAEQHPLLHGDAGIWAGRGTGRAPWG